jgi:hypothetical protein
MSSKKKPLTPAQQQYAKVISSHMLRILHILELLRSCYALCQLHVLEVRCTVPQYHAERSLLRYTVHAHTAHYTLHILLTVTQIAKHNTEVTAGINEILKQCAGQRIPRDVTIVLPPSNAVVAKQIEELKQCNQQVTAQLAATKGTVFTAVAAVKYTRKRLELKKTAYHLLNLEKNRLMESEQEQEGIISNLQNDCERLQADVASRDKTIAVLRAQLAAQAAST